MDRHEPRGEPKADAGPSVVETMTDGTLRRSSLRPADRVGRYEILERVGAGAMGTVFLANDPELDRKVAIKVLHVDARRPEVGARRLVREARTMARLAHPNVVTVHDVGMHDGHVFVAMEFVRGADLRTLMRGEPRPWREVAGWMLQAARGLAAAHDAGVVHRDFKPDNVMVERTGRVCVTDFGLAASAAESRADADVGTAEIAALRDIADPDMLSRTGALVGTPAYLAPEQFAGLPADHLTDQFAFCVSTWEVLFGKRPFVGRTAAELALAVSTGDLAPVSDLRRAPQWLRRLVLRGLSADRSRRLPSMHALADAIDRGLGRRRAIIRWSASVTAIGACAATAAYFGVRGRELDCRASAGVDAVWNAESQAELYRAVTASVPAGGDEIYARLDRKLAAWGTAWHGSRDAVCDAEAQWPPTTREHAHACLEQQVDGLRALLEAAGHVERARAPRLIDAADRLPSPALCSDRAWLDDGLPPPPDPIIAERVEEHRATIARLRARFDTGEIGAVATEIEHAVEVARDIADPALVAEALYLRGELLVADGQPDLAQIVLEEAFFTGTSARHQRIALHAATALASSVAIGSGRPDDGDAWLRHARALLLTVPSDPTGKAQLDTVEADLAMERGRLDEARVLLEGVLDSHRRTGRRSLEAHAEGALGQLAVRNGDHAEARARFERSRALGLAEWGEHHPALADPIIGLATVSMREGDLELAATTMTEALAIYEETLGPEHPNVAGTLHNLGAIAKARGRLDEALAILERVLGIRERVLGRNHPDVGATLGLLATVYEDRGSFELARASSERALAIFIEVYGPRHPRVADVLNNVGTLANDVKDFAGGAVQLERALDIRRATVGDEHPDTAMVLSNLARSRLGLGDRTKARAATAEALAIYRARLGDDHPDTVEMVDLMAEIDREPPPP